MEYSTGKRYVWCGGVHKVFSLTIIEPTGEVVHRVPVRLDNAGIEIELDGIKRMLPLYHAPQELRRKLGLIGLSSELNKPRLTDEDASKWPYSNMYYPPQTSETDTFESIGWRASDTWYCIVMSDPLYQELRGALK